MPNLDRLVRAARDISSQIEITFRGTDEENKWICIVSVGHDAVLFESDPGEIDFVIEEAVNKLKRMSQRIRIDLDPTE